MHVRKTYFLVLALVAFFSGFGQNYGIRKVHAYFRETLPGTIQTIETGQRVGSSIKKEYWLLVETGDVKVPRLTQAWVKGTAFSLKPERVQGNKMALGKKKNSDEEVTIHAGTGGILWLLKTTRLEKVKPGATIRKKLKGNSVVLRGSWKGKTFHYGIKRLDTLSSLMMQ